MDLRYILMNWNSQRYLFLITMDEEEKLRAQFLSIAKDAHIFASGRLKSGGTDTRQRLERWLSRVAKCVITPRTVESAWIAEIVCAAHLKGVHLMELDSFSITIDPTIPAQSDRLIRSLCRHSVRQDRRIRAYSFLKSLIEPVMALVMITVLSPLFLLVAIAVKLTSSGPIIYSQNRVGQFGKIFKIHKFRSMRTNAEAGGPVWSSTKKNDPCLTRIGGFLRSSHLDELPQLWNVLKREISFIGPRPERPEFVLPLEEACSLFKLRLLTKPGITGWAQIKQGYANSMEDSLRKLEYDLFYITKHSPSLDLFILVKTFSVLLSGGTEGMKRETQALHAETKPDLAHAGLTRIHFPIDKESLRVS